MAYASNGNITTKSDVGTNVFDYNHAGKPYALTGIETSSGLIPQDLQTITYTSFEQVSTIDEGDYYATFTYNSDDQRCKMLVTDLGSTLLTRWYAGSRYMKETEGGTTREYTWIGGNAYSAPVVAVKEGSTTSYYYLLRDYLGNITHQVNTANSVVAEYNFDPWGRRRDKDSWSYTLSSEPKLFAGRGFTGHEHLPWFELINMNGRLYDPVVGRFLSPDENVQMPDFSQNFNRYTYCLNNPLVYIDQDGEFFWAAVAIGALINVGSKAISGKIDNVWDALGATVVGGLAGAAGYGAFIKAGATVGFLSGAASGGAGGFVGGAGNAWLDGASFGEGLLAGVTGAVGGAITGGVVSGVSASINGNNFWSGLPTDKTVAKAMASKIAAPKLSASYSETSLDVERAYLSRMPNTMRTLSPIKGTVRTSDSYYNQLYAQKVASLEGKPYIYGANGPNAYDCSSTVCYGIREVKKPRFGDFTAQQLFDLHTVSSSNRGPGTLVFYDWGSNGSINHVTSLLGNGKMLHPSSSAGLLKIISSTKLNNVNNPTIYFRQIKW